MLVFKTDLVCEDLTRQLRHAGIGYYVGVSDKGYWMVRIGGDGRVGYLGPDAASARVKVEAAVLLSGRR